MEEWLSERPAEFGSSYQGERIDLTPVTVGMFCGGDCAEVFESLGRFEEAIAAAEVRWSLGCLLYTSPSPRDATLSRMPSSA